MIRRAGHAFCLAVGATLAMGAIFFLLAARDLKDDDEPAES